MASIAYLGPEGTFTEAALLQMIDAGMVPQHSPAAVRPMPVDSTPAALDAVRDGAAAYACVPIENSIDGSVMPTLDSLAIGTPLQVFAELTLDVAFSIVVKPGRTAADVRTLAAFPVAAAQVRRWLAAHLPAAELRPANSNADAAQQVADGHVDAAVSSPLAATQRGLSTLADGVVDEANACTRFVLVGPPGPPPARTGADRTSVVLRIDNVPERAGVRACRVRYPRHRPDPHRIPSHPNRIRHLPVLPGLRRPHRRRRGRRGTQGAAPALYRCALPGFLADRRACRRAAAAAGRGVALAGAAARRFEPAEGPAR